MEKFKTLKDHVYDYIADQIRDGKLQPNQRINENNNCEELNISRTPVREALIQLSAEGILENRTRKGFVLRSMTSDDIREIYQVIGILDGYAAKLACEKLTAQDYADMEFYIDTMDLALNSGNYDMYHKQLIVFHQLYIAKCGNNALIESISQAKNKHLKKTYQEDLEQKIKEVHKDTNLEHRHILSLFKENDADGLYHYLSETHWAPAYADYDMIG